MIPAIGIITVISLIGCVISIIILANSNSGVGILVSIVIIVLIVFGYLYCVHYSSTNFTQTEIKTVDICDKFTADERYNIATSDGETYYVEREVYGFIPQKGRATIEIRTDGFTGRVSVSKLYSNTTCQVGCV